VSGRSRKSKNFTLPGNPGSAPPPLPMSPAQARRVGELWLINCFTATLWLHWRSRIDPVGTATMVVALGGPAISKKDAAAMYEDAEDDGREPTITMLLAATRWVIGLDLPRSLSDLWSRPAISDSPRLLAAPSPSARSRTPGAPRCAPAPAGAPPPRVAGVAPARCAPSPCAGVPWPRRLSRRAQRHWPGR
jgi:hypothetical protein